MSDSLCTCEVSQTQFLKAMLSIPLIVGHDSQGILVLIQCAASDDAQVVQWEAAELIDSKKDVPCHLLDRLRGKKKEQGREKCSLSILPLNQIVIRVTNQQGRVCLLS